MALARWSDDALVSIPLPGVGRTGSYRLRYFPQSTGLAKRTDVLLHAMLLSLRGRGAFRLLAFVGTPGGLCGAIGGDISICQGDFGPGFEEVGQGMGMTALGLVAIADMPLSLAGDILTLPVVYARSHEYWWATWWGEKSFGCPDLAPPPEEGSKQPEGEVEPTH
jgi:hypothetical protein